MKNVLSQLMIVCMLFLAYSCSKSKNEPNEEPNNEEKHLATQPDAVAAHDGKSGGVYKGVIIGSSGTVMIKLQGGTVSAEITIDSITKVMTPKNMPTGWTSGQPLTNVIFAADNWQLIFSVTGTSTTPFISYISIPGHTNVAVYIGKETSTSLAKAFEGNYYGHHLNTNLGRMNFVLTASTEDSVCGVIHNYIEAKQQIHGTYDKAEKESLALGAHFNNGLTSWIGLGELKGDSVLGSWKAYNVGGWATDSGYWKAKRTL